MQLIEVAPSLIRRSPHNHRTRFTGLEDLADSIIAKGLVSPVTVRPNPDDAGNGVPWELVVGERRWRAATIAADLGKLTTITALVRDLTDQEVIEIQLIENVQRVDVHPLEEAAGYQELIAKYGYTAETIAAKTSRSRSTIYARLRLLDLAPAVQQVFLDGRLPASFAELAVTLSTHELQQAYVDDLLRGRREGHFALAELGNDDGHSPAEGLKAEEDETLDYTFREAKLLLRRRYMLRLGLAVFPIDDATLVPAAGACTTCALRSGNQPDLFGDVGADVCTKPPCFEAKRIAFWERREAEARANGGEVLAPERSAELFRAGRLDYGTEFVDLDGDADWSLQEEGEPTRKWRDVIRGIDDAPEPVLARDDHGAPHELARRDDVIAALRDAGELPDDAIPKAKPDKGKAKIKQLAREAAAKATITGITIAAVDNPTMALEYVARCVIRGAGHFVLEAVAERREMKDADPKTFMRLVDNIEHDDLIGLVAELLACEEAAAVQNADWGENLVDGAKTFKLDLKKTYTKCMKDFADAAKKRGAK